MRTRHLKIFIILIVLFSSLSVASFAETSEKENGYQLSIDQIEMVQSKVQDYIALHGKEALTKTEFLEILKSVDLEYVIVVDERNIKMNNARMSVEGIDVDWATLTGSVVRDEPNYFGVKLAAMNHDPLDTHDMYEIHWSSFQYLYEGSTTSWLTGHGTDTEFAIKPRSSRTVTHNVACSVIYGAWFEYSLRIIDDGETGWYSTGRLTNSFY